MNFLILDKFTFDVIFKIFHENIHYRNNLFQENPEDNIYVKIRELTLVIIGVISLKNAKFWLKTKKIKFLGIEPIFQAYL